MNEEEFINSIDCCFPYKNERQWKALILQGKAISDNASFSVLHEIARKPFGNPVSEKEQLTMVDVWAAENKHPLAKSVVEAAKGIITDHLLSVEKVSELLSNVQAYPNQYQALNIVYFACDDADGLADKKWQDVVNFWKTRGV